MTTEAEFQSQITDLATVLGWQHLHVRRSKGRRNGREAWQTTTNIKGWPDLFLWHPLLGFAAIEVKGPRTEVRPEQVEVLDSLEAAGARTMIARPKDLDAVQALLTNHRKDPR